MKFTPRRVTFLISRLVIALSGVFSALNILFIYLNTQIMMPIALSMTGYLAKTGLVLTDSRDLPFFAICSLTVSGLVCAVLLLGALLAGINRGWMVVAALIILADCTGIGLLIASNGYRSGYWFELVGHAVLIVALIVAFCTMPHRSRILAD